jgi:hypothetical protein
VLQVIFNSLCILFAPESRHCIPFKSPQIRNKNGPSALEGPFSLCRICNRSSAYVNFDQVTDAIENMGNFIRLV